MAESTNALISAENSVTVYGSGYHVAIGGIVVGQSSDTM